MPQYVSTTAMCQTRGAETKVEREDIYRRRTFLGIDLTKKVLLLHEATTNGSGFERIRPDVHYRIK